MAIIVNGIRAGLEERADDVINRALARIKRKRGALKDGYIMKTSVDARHRASLCLVYSVGLELFEDEAGTVAAANDPTVTLRRPRPYAPPIGLGRLAARPVIVGFGPAGIFAGLLLARNGYAPLIVERGAQVEERVHDVERFFSGGTLDTQSNVQFGEGGAGTFSDGKLTTRIGDPRCETVLAEFLKNGAPPSVRTLAKPHIGTDKLRLVVRNMRERIAEAGGEIRFHTTLTGIGIKNGSVRSVFLNGQEVEAGAVILAVGHSARDTFSALLDAGVTLAPKPFSVGVRIEHLQSEIDRALYGALAGHPALPHGEYQLSHRQGERAVYTFCMCPGGSVVAAASEAGGVVTNGMSQYDRGGKNANAALAVSVSPSDYGTDPLDGVRFQQQLERAAFAAATGAGGGAYSAPAQTVSGFLGGGVRIGGVNPTYPLGVVPCDLATLFPPYVSGMLRTGLTVFDKKLRGFAAENAVLTGVETRTSSPVRITRGETFEAEGIGGLYPAGEGAGYAGGIMSAAVDGLRAAEAVMARFAPPDKNIG